MSRKLDVALGRRSPPARAVPRRTHDRSGPRGAGGDVGGDRARSRPTRRYRPADDALPRRGGPHRRPAGDRRPRASRGRGHAGRPQARTARRRRPGGIRPTATVAAGAGGLRRVRGLRGARRGRDDGCARARTAARPPSRPWWRRWTHAASPATSVTVAGRRWTTCTCATSAAAWRWRHERDDGRPRRAAATSGTRLAAPARRLLTARSTRALWRQPAFAVATLVQPIIWLLLFGALFQGVVDIPGLQRRATAPTSSSSPRASS